MFDNNNNDLPRRFVICRQDIVLPRKIIRHCIIIQSDHHIIVSAYHHHIIISHHQDTVVIYTHGAGPKFHTIITHITSSYHHITVASYHPLINLSYHHMVIPSFHHISILSLHHHITSSGYCSVSNTRLKKTKDSKFHTPLFGEFSRSSWELCESLSDSHESRDDRLNSPKSAM